MKFTNETYKKIIVSIVLTMKATILDTCTHALVNCKIVDRGEVNPKKDDTHSFRL